MLGVLFATISAFFDEAATDIGKLKVKQREMSIYTMGLINCVIATAVLTVFALIRKNFIFSLASLPTFCLRTVLEIILTQCALLAICRADRSTFVFIRILTIPILLLVDLAIGYKISFYQFLGITLIIIVLGFISFDRKIKKQGAGLSLATALLAVVTISLYKYDITYFNSVEAEQIIINLIIIVYLSVMAFAAAKENPWRFFTKPIYILQSLSSGAAGVLNSYAYLFAAPSVIIASFRSAGVITAVFSGSRYFREKNFWLKLGYSFILIISIVLLVF